MPSHAGRQTASDRRVPGLDGRLLADPAIEVAGLSKSFGPVQVLRGVEFQVRRGSVFSLLGPNGAGKTTIVRILSTLARVGAGRVRVAGWDVVTEAHEVRRNISLTGQYAAIDELQTGEETLRMMGRLWGLRGEEARRRSTELLEQFELAGAGRRQVRHYSGGMRRRLDLAASLVSRPAVIFLDEPTTGLDVRSRQSMWEAVKRLAADGSTIFLTTQYLEEADQLAGQVAILDGGRIVAAGHPGGAEGTRGGRAPRARRRRRGSVRRGRAATWAAGAGGGPGAADHRRRDRRNRPPGPGAPRRVRSRPSRRAPLRAAQPNAR